MSESTKVKSDSDSVTGTNSADPNENNAGKDEPNEDCGENEGVLVANLADETEFHTEETSDSKSQLTSSKPNNINLCNTNEAENIDDNSLLVGVSQDESGLYDDVMTAPNISASEFQADLMGPSSHESQNSENKPDTTNGKSLNEPSHQQTKPSSGYVKRVPCYVGNLTWWTSDKDLTEVVTALGLTDLLDIKFYENKINGQSKGFAQVTFGSDQSFRLVMEKLPKKEVNGQFPIVTPFSRHNFNQFEEQARKDMPSVSGNGNSNGGSHDGGHGQYQGNRADGHHGGGNGGGGNNVHHGGHQNSFQHGQMMNRNRFPTNTGNSNMPAGILGQGPRPNGPSNNMMQQQRPGLVGNYQPRNNMNGPMNNQSQQSIMGMGNPGIMGNNNSIRPGFNSNAGFNVMQNNRTNQASLLGNRPPLVNSNSNGLIPMRPGINPALVGNNGPIGQGVGLLNNPRIPHMAQGGNMQQQRQDWDRNGQNGNGPMNGQFVNGQNGQAGVNSMMMMGQNQNSRMGQAGPNTFPYSGNMNGPNPTQNGILPNPPLPFQQQQHTQPNFQHPHANQQSFNPQAALIHGHQPSQIPGQQPQQPGLLNNTQMPGAAMVSPNIPQNMAQLNGPNLAHNPQAYGQEQYYHNRSNDQQVQSPVLNQHGINHQQMQLQQQHKLSDMEFQEAFEKNRIVSSSAITRAVQDASIGQYASAIETLITAISLIKQSKIASDERCKLFILSLQDTKKDIEDKYYGGGGRSMSGGGVGIESGMLSGSGGHGRGESRDRERLKRSRSRDSRDRRERDREDRDRDRDRDRERGSRREKHHRSHRERSSRDRSRDRRVVTSNDGMGSSSDYYDEPLSSQSSRYTHRSRH